MPDIDRHTAVLAELRLWLAKNREDLEWLDPQYPAGALASVVHLTRPDTGLLFRMLLDDVDRLTAERDELRARIDAGDDEPGPTLSEPGPRRVLQARIVSRRTRPPLVIEDFDDPDPGQAYCEGDEAARWRRSTDRGG